MKSMFYFIIFCTLKWSADSVKKKEKRDFNLTFLPHLGSFQCPRREIQEANAGCGAII